MTIPFAYKGEAMLVRWSETPKGRTVTLLLDPLVGEQHPFKFLKCGENGQRMQIAAALIGDDEKPAVPPTKRNGPRCSVELPAEKPHAETAKPEDKPRTPKKRSSLAYLLCQDKAFQDWILDQPFVRGAVINHHAFKDQADITDWLLKRGLNVTSKSELDTDPEAAARFDALRTDYELRDMVR